MCFCVLFFMWHCAYLLHLEIVGILENKKALVQRIEVNDMMLASVVLKFGYLMYCTFSILGRIFFIGN